MFCCRWLKDSFRRSSFLVFSVFSFLSVLRVNVLVVSEWLALREHKHYKMT